MSYKITVIMQTVKYRVCIQVAAKMLKRNFLPSYEFTFRNSEYHVSYRLTFIRFADCTSSTKLQTSCH